MKQMSKNKKIAIGVGVTGAVALLFQGTINANQSQQVTLTPSAPIGEAKVKQLVEIYAGLTNLNYEQILLKTENNRRVYEVDAYKNSMEYDLTVDAITGEVISSEFKHLENSVATTTQNANTTVNIHEDKAKEIALQKTGKQQLNYQQIRLTQDDDYNRARVYEIDAISDTDEYDIVIHATTGEVLKFEVEKLSSKQEALTVTTAPSNVTREQEKSNSVQNNVQATVQREQSTINNVQKAQPAQQVATPVAPKTQTVAQSVPSTTTQNVAPKSVTPVQNTISQSRVKQIVSQRTGKSNLHYTKLALTRDDDYGFKPVYEVEARLGNVEYELDIDAATGAILSYSTDIDD